MLISITVNLGIDQMKYLPLAEAEYMGWIKDYGLAIRTAHSLIQRISFPKNFIRNVPISVPFEKIENDQWTLQMDQQLMEWANARPIDFAPGGSSKIYLWGSGRHFELADAGQT